MKYSSWKTATGSLTTWTIPERNHQIGEECSVPSKIDWFSWVLVSMFCAKIDLCIKKKVDYVICK